MENIKVYNKLVRDKIPEIIHIDYKICDFEMIDGRRKFRLLQKKLQEEVNEFLADNRNIDELADIMEVVFAIADILGVSEEELLKVRTEKREKRGGFEQGIFLKTVKERK